jgi:heme/copper-type cytochrome/quinol oxidase subunit 3
VATSVPVQLAYSAARRDRLVVARLALLLALVVQAGYLGIQVHLFLGDLDKFSPDQSAYASIYFTMLGGHHFHVLLGILLEAWLLVRLVAGLTRYRLVALQATVFYWHFVNVLAVAVVLMQVSPAL